MRRPTLARAGSAPASTRCRGAARCGGHGWAIALVAVLSIAGAAGCGAAERSAAPGAEARGAAERSSPSPVAGPDAASGVLELVARVLDSYPHERDAFTQGLVYFRGKLYESTGGYGDSTLRRVELATGRVELGVELPRTLFGEGLERVGRRLVQLTWREGHALVWDLERLVIEERWPYDGEGWGLCHDGNRLIRSDGTDRLVFHDPHDFRRLDDLRVTRAGAPQPWLNELECAEGYVYANVWQRDEIVRIEPATGRVEAVVDASGLLAEPERARAGVLNGIAYDPATQTFLVTGKNWPRLLRVVFVPK